MFAHADRNNEELSNECYLQVSDLRIKHFISHPITGFKDDRAYVTTKTADRNQRSTEDGSVLSDVIYALPFHTWKLIIWHVRCYYNTWIVHQISPT